MLKSTREVLQARGFAEGTNASPASYVIERAFVEQ